MHNGVFEKHLEVIEGRGPESVSRSSDRIDAIDDIGRLASQALGVLACLSAEDNFKNLTDETIRNTLWLLRDQLEGINSASECL